MQISVEKPFEAWVEMQRQGQDLAHRLAHGFTELIQSHMNPPCFAWPEPPRFLNGDFPIQGFEIKEFGLVNRTSGVNGVSAILSHMATSFFPWTEPSKLFHVNFPSQCFEIKNFGSAAECSGVNSITAILGFGNKLGQVGADMGACLNGMVEQFLRWCPVVSLVEENSRAHHQIECLNGGNYMGIALHEGLKNMGNNVGNLVNFENHSPEDSADDELDAFPLEPGGHSAASEQQGSLSITSTYDGRTRKLESSLAAKGDLWRLNVSRGGGDSSSSIALLQLGPMLLIRDSSTFLLPLHLSKQHLLWFGYDRKNGVHSLCPAAWSKHRRWLLMSMICLRPIACSFVEVQFPNGQVTYVSGEGISTSAYLPLFGGVLQADGQYPGEMRFSFSYKNKWGTRITPAVQLPDRSMSVGLEQGLMWRQQSGGLLIRPALRLSVTPTFGGSNPGVQVETVHSVSNGGLSFICRCAWTDVDPSLSAAVSVGRSKWNGNVGNSGLVIKAQTRLPNFTRPSLSVQLNAGIDF